MVRAGELLMILELHKQGVAIAAIARQMNMDRKTVRKYIEQGLQAPTYGPRQPRPCKLDGFRDYLAERKRLAKASFKRTRHVEGYV